MIYRAPIGKEGADTCIPRWFCDIFTDPKDYFMQQTKKEEGDELHPSPATSASNPIHLKIILPKYYNMIDYEEIGDVAK